MRLIEIDNIYHFKRDDELVKEIVESTVFLIFPGGEVLNVEEKVNLERTLEDGGIRIWTKDGGYWKLDDFSHMIVKTDREVDTLSELIYEN